ncbi:MAG: hypothetical protein KBG47_10555 [Bacteroidia bacterium]|nr:hypothetical protein [Bacteroidia bacterium]
MKKIILYFAVVLAPIIHEAQTQNLYYKTLTDSIINTFSVDTNHLSIKRTDPMIKYKNYFNYVLCFYKNLEYKKIRIKSQKAHHIADVKPAAIDVIASAEDRVYTIIFSSEAPSLLDTVTFEKLSVDSKIALISQQISLIKEYSNSGFFEVIGMRFKKYKIKRGKELHKDINLYTIEAGLGHQLITYTNEMTDKLFEENWTDKHAYKIYYEKNMAHMMNVLSINAYLHDYPVYLHNIYK